MAAISAGLMLYRRVGARGDGPTASPGAPSPRVQVLLVHPGGPYWTHKHAGAWSIPKGEVEPYELDDGEDGRLAAARREFREETGFDPHDLAGPGGRYLPLGGVKQRGHKIVYAWALEGDCDPSLIVSEQLEMEWPPRSGRTITIPEVDRAEWFDLGAAREAINPGQRRFLDELEALLDVPAEAR